MSRKDIVLELSEGYPVEEASGGGRAGLLVKAPGELQTEAILTAGDGGSDTGYLKKLWPPQPCKCSAVCSNMYQSGRLEGRSALGRELNQIQRLQDSQVLLAGPEPFIRI